MTDANNEIIAAQEATIRLLKKRIADAPRITETQQETMDLRQAAAEVYEDMVWLSRSESQPSGILRWGFLAVALFVGAAIGGAYVHWLSWIAR